MFLRQIATDKAIQASPPRPPIAVNKGGCRNIDWISTKASDDAVFSLVEDQESQSGEAFMHIVGCDFHVGWQQIAVLDTETIEIQGHKLENSGGEAAQNFGEGRAKTFELLAQISGSSGTAFARRSPVLFHLSHFDRTRGSCPY